MVSVAWNESFSVGNAQLDSDHRILFELIAQLHDAMETGQTRDVVGSVVGVLVEYVQYHFRREEALFAATAYPDAQSHAGQHRALEGKVVAIHRRWLDGDRDALDEAVLALLKKWLTEHIMVVDKSYTPWLAGDGAVETSAGRN